MASGDSAFPIGQPLQIYPKHSPVVRLGLMGVMRMVDVNARAPDLRWMDRPTTWEQLWTNRLQDVEEKRCNLRGASSLLQRSVCVQ